MLLVFGLTAGTQTAMAQDPLGDEFILFFDGPNVLIPVFDGEIVDDPLDGASGNQVARFNYGQFNLSGFRWDGLTGVDATGFAGETANASDTLYVRILSDPANVGQPNVSLAFTDKDNDSAASREEAEADPSGVDHEMRLIWTIPQEWHDGQWHEAAIPLPPTTLAALDSAKVGKAVDGSDLATPLDSLSLNWAYTGAWTNGGYGVGPGFGVPDDPLFREFEWDALQVIGVFFDNNSGGGPIFLDNLYIGGPNTDVSAAEGAPAAMSGVTFGSEDGESVISWTHNTDFGAYNVYVAEEPITDVGADGVSLIATVPFNAESFEVRHSVRAPHPSLAAAKTLHYAVASTSLFGVANPDVSGSSGNVTNDLESDAFIVELTADQGDELFNNIASGIADGSAFPEGTVPFVINSDRVTPGDVAVLPDSDTDLAVTVLFGFTEFNELYMYAEVIDDDLVFAGEGIDGGNTWQFDAIEIGYGGYELDSFLAGSDHTDMQRGETPDYQFRIAGRVDDTGELGSNPSTFIGWSQDAEHEAGGSAVEYLTDESGARIGYKVLTLIALDAIQNPDEGDTVLDAPASDELKLIPFTLVVADNDAGAREHQVSWTLNPSFGANWWNTPAQWSTVAMAGANVTATSTDDLLDVPGVFALDQNYPNPFNPQTSIRFQLPSAESVTLTVYNTLGQQVATLVNGQTLTAGTHTVAFDGADLASGLYLYRLEAGSAFTQTRTMLLVK
ncbi:MAG: T9SS type A sorting domain-containing protein [Bacteroidota bacterium]